MTMAITCHSELIEFAINVYLIMPAYHHGTHNVGRAQ